MPTKILELSGAAKNHPERLKERRQEFKPTGPLGDPPNRLKASERRAWIEITEALPEGVLTNADRHIMEITCRLLAEFWFPAPDAPPMATARIDLLRRCLGSLGMTPADRSKVRQPEGKGATKW